MQPIRLLALLAMMLGIGAAQAQTGKWIELSNDGKFAEIKDAAASDATKTWRDALPDDLAESIAGTLQVPVRTLDYRLNAATGPLREIFLLDGAVIRNLSGKWFVPRKPTPACNFDYLAKARTTAAKPQYSSGFLNREARHALYTLPYQECPTEISLPAGVSRFEYAKALKDLCTQHNYLTCAEAYTVFKALLDDVKKSDYVALSKTSLDRKSAIAPDDILLGTNEILFYFVTRTTDHRKNVESWNGADICPLLRTISKSPLALEESNDKSAIKVAKSNMAVYDCKQ